MELLFIQRDKLIWLIDIISSSEPMSTQVPIAMAQTAPYQPPGCNGWSDGSKRMPVCPVNPRQYQTPPSFPQNQVDQSFRAIGPSHWDQPPPQ